MSEEINSGTLINNRYLIEKTLGRGGFGRTYLALDTHRFQEPCVLKEFLPNTNNAKVISKSKELFEREAKVLYQIQHPQIPQFLALLTHNQQLFIVQEYINGKTYLQILDERLSTTGKPFSETEVREWLLKMLPVLEYIHSCNIIHRDISLENVMLPDNGAKPVLIDFGVVKQKFSQIFLTDSSSEQYCTKASVVGKIGYSPPEQLRLGQCYPSSDIYALGVCAVILLTGKMPYLLIDESLNWQWQKKVKISDDLTKILGKMLVELPTQRYQSAKEVIIELEHNLNSHQNFHVSDNNLKQKRSLGGIISSLLPKKTYNNEKLRDDEQLIVEKLGQTPVSLNPQFVDYCQRQLTSFVGPFASVLMQQTLDENPDIASKEFVEVLANKIPHAQLAEDFIKKIQLLNEFKLEKTTKLNESSLNLIKSPAISNPDFLDHCRRELTSFVGPFASVVIRDTLEECPHFTPKQLVESLVAGIPNQKRAKEFQKRILNEQ
ncbi:MAG: serine/threonine-protein kinase [Nostocales cyanobacterium 94392]|nr:serine/threonine-protein kinase [Nostocales cyanobacterium 94392]